MTGGASPARDTPGGGGGGAKVVPAGCGLIRSGVPNAEPGRGPVGGGGGGLLGARARAAGLRPVGNGGGKSSSSGGVAGRGGGGARAGADGGSFLGPPAEGAGGADGEGTRGEFSDGRRGGVGAARLEAAGPGRGGGRAREDAGEATWKGVRCGRVGGPVGRGGGGGARYEDSEWNANRYASTHWWCTGRWGRRRRRDTSLEVDQYDHCVGSNLYLPLELHRLVGLGEQVLQ